MCAPFFACQNIFLGLSTILISLAAKRSKAAYTKSAFLPMITATNPPIALTLSSIITTTIITITTTTTTTVINIITIITINTTTTTTQ